MNCLLLLPLLVSQPNVLVIVADDVGPDGPVPARLVEEGVVFTQARSAWSVCSPTRAALLTGLHPTRTGVVRAACHLHEEVLHSYRREDGAVVSATRLKLGYRTLPEVLADAGYACGHFGKWHLGREDHGPLQHGFDVAWPQEWTAGPPGRHYGTWERDTADRVLRFMEDVGRPWFALWCTWNLHAPLDECDPDDLQRQLDRVLSRVPPNTLVIYTSDNGPLPWKGTEADLGVRVPLVAWWPERLAPATTQASASTVDLYPTIAQVARAEAPDRDGTSLWPELAGSRYRDRPVFGAHADPPCRWVTWYGYRLVEYDDGRRAMYDLYSDPLELEDLYTDDGYYAEILRALVDTYPRGW